MYEIEGGRRFRLTYKPRELAPVSEALKIQGRFRHLTEQETDTIQRMATENWDRLLALDGGEIC